MPRPKANVAARKALGLHRRIQENRERLGVTRAQMADWLGIHVSNYALIESGEVAITAERVSAVARLLKVSVAELYGEGEAPIRPAA